MSAVCRPESGGVMSGREGNDPKASWLFRTNEAAAPSVCSLSSVEHQFKSIGTFLLHRQPGKGWRDTKRRQKHMDEETQVKLKKGM